MSVAPGSVARRAARPSDNYTMIHNRLLRDPGLPMAAKGLGAWLLSHSEEFRFSVDSIARQMGCGKDAVRTALRHLEESGYLVREPIRHEGRFTGYRYVITDDPGGCPIDGKPADGPAADGPADPYKKTKFQEDQPEEDQEIDIGHPGQQELVSPTPPAQACAAGAVAAFDQFWSAYPKRVGKLAARRAWMKAIKNTKPSRIIDGAVQYARQRQGQDATYTANPATWLNQGRWMDEHPSAPAPSPTSNGGYRPYKDRDYWPTRTTTGGTPQEGPIP